MFFWAEISEAHRFGFHCSFILAGVGAGKIGGCPQGFGHCKVMTKVLVIIEGEGMDFKGAFGQVLFDGPSNAVAVL